MRPGDPIGLCRRPTTFALLLRPCRRVQHLVLFLCTIIRHHRHDKRHHRD
jgi:hypothetical protein